MSEIFLIKNINLKNFIRKDTTLFIKIFDDDIYTSFKDIIEKSFSCEKSLLLRLLNQLQLRRLLKLHLTLSNLVGKKSLANYPNKKVNISKVFRSFLNIYFVFFRKISCFKP